ncbi:MFS transporter [Bifidobacterium breve]|uniref:MFS transporter n=2 Tax=Bifidobacterium breve TaxID=1685 RepID=UPI0022AF5C54|nr:MFS transporter [Bifidobacterium breve]MCZ4421860.1 MFS transporter [Bifidobacterium breve]
MAREMLGVICNPLTSTLWCGLGQRNITVAADGKWFVADSCTSLSSSIQGFALPLIAQTVPGSPAQATLLDSIMTLISSVLRLPSGVVQDKYDRKKLMIAFGLIGFVLFGICAALGWAGLLIYPVLMVLAICLGMGMIETIAAPAITFLSGIAMQHWGYSVTSVALGLCIVAAAIPAVTMRELVTLPKPDGWEDHIRKSGLTKF